MLMLMSQDRYRELVMDASSFELRRDFTREAPNADATKFFELLDMATTRTKFTSRVTFYISEATFYIVKLKFLASSSSIPVKLPSTLSFNFGAHRHRLAKESRKRPSNMELFEMLCKKNRHEGDWRDARSEKVVHAPVIFANVVDPALDLHLDQRHK